MIVAHRGASKEAPENTIPAFRLAWEEEADAIEGDFRLTADGYIVCIHDKATKRVANVDLVVEKSTLEELRKLDVGSHCSNKYRGTFIPTIREVFTTVPEKKKIYIEIKCGKSIVPHLLKEINQSSLKYEQIVIISYDKNVIHAVKTKAPCIKVLLVTLFSKDKSGNITPPLETLLETMSEIRADGLSSGKDNVTESLVKSVLKRGYEYHVWTVDDPETAIRLRKWGVNSITTNVPGFMRKNLAEKRKDSRQSRITA